MEICFECHYAEYNYAECHYAERKCAECHYTECRGIHSIGEELAFSEAYWMKSMKTSERQTETTLGKSVLCIKL